MATRGVNKVILVGRLGKDPEVRQTQMGESVAKLSLATSEQWTDKQGNKQERTEWHNVAMFGKFAEIAGKYLKKGSRVYAEGKIQTRKWQDNQGQDRYSTEIVLPAFGGVLQMLDSKSDQQQGQRQQQAPQQQYQQQYQQPQVNDTADEDIPF